MVRSAVSATPSLKGRFCASPVIRTPYRRAAPGCLRANSSLTVGNRDARAFMVCVT